MFDFQTEKYRRIKAGKALGPEYERGFIETGLWSWSRHPNYFCEVSIWWAFYLFTVGATEPTIDGWERYINWTIVGPLFLTCLFVPPGASLDVTESLSSRKYAAYPEYQASVSRFIPLPPGLLGSKAKQPATSTKSPQRRPRSGSPKTSPARTASRSPARARGKATLKEDGPTRRRSRRSVKTPSKFNPDDPSSTTYY